MTLHAQHLAYLPAVRRHLQGKKCQVKLAVMRALEWEWSQMPEADRYRELIPLLEEQIRKIQENEFCPNATLMDEKLIENYLHFNCMAAELQMRGII